MKIEQSWDRKKRMLDIPTIPTIYKGVTFRSRLEARWAYYFDLIGLPWLYEDEGYILETGEYYLPDFHIKDFGYIEIKPDEGDTSEAIEKCRLLSKHFEVALIVGPPNLNAQRCFKDSEEVCSVVFTKYSVRKWGSTPFYAGVGCGAPTHFNEEVEEVELINQANAKRWGNK